MGESRRQYEAKFKLETVLELLKGEKTAAQICRERGISQDLLSRWKDTFRERAVEIFRDGRAGVSEEAARIEELERLVGQQALELAVLKKATTFINSRSARSGR
jgi:transposase-like protein